MIIVGSGLVGSLWAYILKIRGYDVTVFEKRSNPKNQASPAGRSINLIITSRGLRGLEVAGLLEKILPITVPVYGRQIHAKTGETLFQPYGRDKSECNYSVSRWDLNKALIEACESIGIKIHFEHDIESIDFKNKILKFKTPTETKTQNYTQVFATDGAGSVIRKSLIENFPNDYHEQVDWLDSDYKEVHLPKLSDGSAAIEKNALHIWPRGTHMMMGLANADSSFTMTLYLPKANHSFAFSNLQTEKNIEDLFQSEFADSIQHLPHYKKEFLTNPQGQLATVRLNKWVYQDSVALMGDSSHAIVPFFGQGMNLGFEDCTTFIKLLDEPHSDWAHAFQNYDESRRPNANAIADMALENFIEMSDKVGDLKFQFKKKIESLIEKEFPEMYRSRYGLITYTLTPYALAKEVGVKQSALLDSLLSKIQKPEDLNLLETKKLLETEFTPWMKAQGINTQSYKPKLS